MTPLADIRIIAIEQYGAGPFGTLHLADLGAEVIKIEDPRFGGDVSRYVPPYQEGEDSLFFETFNRNKRSIGLDISTGPGRAVFEDLVKVSDVVYSNLRGDVPARLRLRYDDLKHLNPRIVCVSLSAFGMTGERRDQPGYDYMLQALAGWMSVTGEPGGPPAKSGFPMVDFSGGFVGATALLAGVHAARRDGVGMDCDVSLYDAAVSLQTYIGTWHLTGGHEPERTSRSAHPSLVPFQLFQGSDEKWFVVGCAKEKFWSQLAHAIGLPDLATDDRFSSFSARSENGADLIELLDQRFADETADHWLEALEAAVVPSAPVLSVPESLIAQQTEDRGLIVETDHPRFGRVRQLASPVRVGDPTQVDYRRAPFRGEDTEQILTDLLRYERDHIDSLTEAGAFGKERENDGDA